MLNLNLKKIIEYGIYLVVFLIPTYIFSFKIWLIPTNLLEALVSVLFLAWFIGNFNKIPEISRSMFKSSFFPPILLIFLGASISTIFSDDIITSAGIWKSWFIVPLLFFVVVLNAIKNGKQVQKIISSLFFSGFWVSLIALFYFFSHNLTYDGRLKAFYESPNHLAMYLSPILILSLYLYFVFDKKIIKFFLFAAHCSLLVVLYLTYSYGAWIGLIASLFFLLATIKKQKKIFYLIGIMFLIVASFFAFQINSQKFQGMIDFSYPSLSSRFVIWQSAWEIIKDQPFNGIGPGLFQEYYLKYQVTLEPYLEWAVPQPHNLFLAFWLQTGLLGLLGFIWLLFRFFRIKINSLAIILMATMICVLIHGLVDTTYWKNDLAVVFWLIIALNYKAIRLSY
ncbi:O-antigen ligase family protein [Patescibacteria group bacterium]|nr:O-antigen ligase family protein [Patescibacteria group bacterium]MBU4082502.1 O-antigen ligase family protein [Patescibacteria group bacterium]MCG2809183.1 O-antigen ligase family protein [Candidatus Portnoybacteria bacterium]